MINYFVAFRWTCLSCKHATRHQEDIYTNLWSALCHAACIWVDVNVMTLSTIDTTSSWSGFCVNEQFICQSIQYLIHYFFVHKFYFPFPPCPVYISVAIVLLLFASDINTYTHIVLSSLPVLRIASPLWCTLQSTSDHMTVSLSTNHVYTSSMLYINYYSV